MNLGGLNKNTERIHARKCCHVCKRVFGDNEYKVMIENRYYCKKCRGDIK